MAQVNAFRGWRYDLSQVGSLSDVTAPPYDVIGPDQQKALYERHACNVIRLILNRDEPGDESTDARYARAANFLRHWQSEGALTREREDALYVYHQVFDWEGNRYVRKGFLGRLRLEEFGEGKVFPHEQTLSGPKADRLALTKACRMNLSPIFGMYPDDEGRVQSPLEKAIVGQTPLEATDDLHVVHRMWPVSDPEAISRTREALRDKSVFIADGHHRYETALNYRNWLKSEGRLKDDEAAANFVLMHFVGMSDPGLAILPTHRLVSGLPPLTADDVKQALGSHFKLEDVGTGSSAASETWEMMAADGAQDVFGFGTAADGRWQFARLSDGSPMRKLAADRSDEWRSLSVSLLHRLVLDHLIGGKYAGREQKCSYVHLLDEVNAAMSAKTCQLACLVAPAGIEHVEAIASKYEKMPPKSTYFYPKLLSGLVFNPLE
ncbi:MAG: DUF1015 domain-containing protein [Planctomycetaceae bacterium]